MPESNLSSLFGEMKQEIEERDQIISIYRERVLRFVANMRRAPRDIKRFPMILYALGIFVWQGFDLDSVNNPAESPETFERNLRASETAKRLEDLGKNMPSDFKLDLLGFYFASQIANTIATSDEGLLVAFAAGYCAARKYAAEKTENLPVMTENIPESEI